TSSRVLFLAGCLVSTILVCVHLTLVGVLWQLTTVYLLILILLCILGIRYLHSEVIQASGEKRGLFSAVSMVAVLILAPLLSVLCFIVFPLFELPRPDGEHLVGTRVLYLTDQSRPELYTEQADLPRRLRVRTWYPADAPTSEKSEYWQHASPMSTEFTKIVGLPSFIFSHLDKVRTNAFVDADLLSSADPFPLILFSHGAVVGYAEQNTTLAETLASHGYVVVSIDHSFTNLYVEFPDGSVATNEVFLRDYVQAGSELDQESVSELEEALRSTESLDTALDILSQIDQLTPFATAVYRKQIETWKNDHSFVLDYLLEESPDYAGKLDSDRIGIMGMSMGGYTALHSLYGDDRFKAGINLDGYNYQSVNHPEVTKPMLYFDSDQHFLPKSLHKQIVESLGHSPGYLLKVPAAQHFNFSDVGLFAYRLYSLSGQLGEVEPLRMASIIDAYVLAFFNKHLKAMTEPLLEAQSPNFPEVEMVL
ncbi:MAG: prolyl oligopeptidase family serine peptidase, partial [Pseudomonadales bacterium]|nr:prolyl oligopeptidase family serine peptidase [Pseudomonadales bacterium]